MGADTVLRTKFPIKGIYNMLHGLVDNDVLDLVGAGAPTQGSSGTGAKFAGPMSTYWDITNKQLYVNVNTKATPCWCPLSITDITQNTSGTVQSTFYTLNSCAIPANVLSANGKGFSFMFAGTTSANANAKSFQLSFGGVTVTLTTGNTGNAQPFTVYGSVVRSAAGAQIVVAEIVIGTASPVPVVTTTAADETTAWTFALQSANTAAAAASATGKLGQVTFQNM
jgi:hypothetical protein